MIHTNMVADNEFGNRIEGNTQPHNGANLYAENRQTPPIPWNPDADVARSEQ